MQEQGGEVQICFSGTIFGADTEESNIENKTCQSNAFHFVVFFLQEQLSWLLMEFSSQKYQIIHPNHTQTYPLFIPRT